MIAACATAGSTPSEELLARIVPSAATDSAVRRGGHAPRRRCCGDRCGERHGERGRSTIRVGGAGNAARSSHRPPRHRTRCRTRDGAARGRARSRIRYEVLRAVSSRAELELREELSDLAAAGLVFRQHRAQSESWFFKHALLRDATYESIVRPAAAPASARRAHVARARFPRLRAAPSRCAHPGNHEGARRGRAGDRELAAAADAALRKAAFVQESQQQAEHRDRASSRSSAVSAETPPAGSDDDAAGHRPVQPSGLRRRRSRKRSVRRKRSPSGSIPRSRPWC